ncbi:SNF2-related protein [Auraticoccus monumenti]|uniref:Helicase conserved C-terminal domain-containing protein n=1 Tax=Auraticoccus monumenti TaxID=675864 RepID=A0A1G6TCY4_9ACTN|nr:SNF2-related protein [Auraticoccus monumenti]SDD26297.1 Helicase conserved C-terminal domain-containing protein [Auraticoccus monumenti]
MTEGLLEPGRVITLRNRLWRVDYVDGELLAATPLDGRDSQTQRFHAALETVEPGEMPIPGPDAIGDHRQQEHILDAYRFSLLHGTAPILGLQRSRAIPTDFQLVPLLMSLGQEQVRLLIADDVGTGKTVEAGLVLSELIARGRARRVLVVVPANLREQWREALDHFFHLDATPVAGHLMPALERQLLPGQTVWAAHDVVIASIDYVKTRTDLVLSHHWDVVLIDEAHLCARPHADGRGGNPDMERWLFAQKAAKAARHLLMLTATPHNGHTDSYASLFEMLDPTLVREVADVHIIERARAKRSNVVQRRRQDIESWYETRGIQSPFPRRDADEDIVDLRGFRDMQALLAELGGYAGALYEAADSRQSNSWVAAHLQRRALSSPEALRKSVANRLRALEQQSATETSAKADKAARETTADLVLAADDDAEGAYRLDVAQSALGTDVEIEWLTKVRDRARKVVPAKDPKLLKLLQILPGRMAKHPDVQRVLVFTKFTDTLAYLKEQLEKATLPGTKLPALPPDTQILSIDGSMNLATRMRVLVEFERSPRAVLVATDCISEGLNLQRACAELVHYELPWNPNRLEQRNGRIDRFRQREEFVGIRTLVLDDRLDVALLMLIVKKAEAMRRQYGFVPPFLANPDILLHLANPGMDYRIAPTLFDFEADEENLDRDFTALVDASIVDEGMLDRVLDESFYGQADVSLSLVEAALDRSRSEIGTPDRITAFSRAAIRDLHGTVTEFDNGTFSITAVPPLLSDVTDPTHRYTFDASLGMDDPDVDVVDLAHPLLRRLVDISREQAHNPSFSGRVAGMISQDATALTAVAHVLMRYVARGTPPVLLEELVPVVLPVYGDALDPDAVQHLRGRAGAGLKDRHDLQEDAKAVLCRQTVRNDIAAVATARAASMAERHAELDDKWAAGLNDVTPMSQDLVALTLVYPEVKL